MEEPAVRRRHRWGVVREKLRSLDAAAWPEPERKLPDQAKRALEEKEHGDLWEEVCAPRRILQDREALTGEDLAGHCTLLAYRTTKLLAFHSRLLRNPEQLLGDVSPVAWGMPLRPAPGPLEKFDNLHLRPHASPEQFYQAYLLLRGQLRLMDGSPLDSLYEFLARSPWHLVRSWPSLEEVLDFEEGLVELAEERVMSAGRRAALETLRSRFCFSTPEANGLIRAACRGYRAQGNVDEEVERGLAITRLEDAMRRARRAKDLKLELDALKHLAHVAGLTRGRAQREEEGMDLLDALSTLKPTPKPKPPLLEADAKVLPPPEDRKE